MGNQKRRKTFSSNALSKRRKKEENEGNSDYGVNADPGESSPDELKTDINNLVERLQVSSEERDKIERATVGQAMNSQWKHEKRFRSTASTCSRIFTFADWNDNKNLLKDTCYPKDLSFLPNIINGINLEPVAKLLYSSIVGVQVEECGLHVYRKNGVLGASPDGLLPYNGILEVKCVNCPPADIPKRPDNFLIHEDKKDPTTPLILRKTHKYYRQIVMQLYVCEKDYCDLFVYHRPKNPALPPVHIPPLRIKKDKETDELWKEIEKKLLHFWNEDQAPEHVNPRFPYTKAFRTPRYRAEAIARKEKEKKEEEEKKNRPRMSKEDLSASIVCVINEVVAMK